MDSYDLVDIMVAYYKDKVQNETILKVKEELKKVIEAKADAQRKTTAARIMKMAKLKIALERFEATYAEIKKISGNIDAVDQYILKTKSSIARLSYLKNNHKC